MEYTGQLTVDDAVRGFRLHRRRQPGWRWWLLAPGLLLLAGLAELESRHFGLALAPAVLIVVVLAMTLVQVIVPWQLRRALAEQAIVPALPYANRREGLRDPHRARPAAAPVG
jgi:hypothetical protein